MKKFLMPMLLAATVACLAHADLKVFATVPEWGALAKRNRRRQGQRVTPPPTPCRTRTAYEARPSLLAQARRAQLLVVATGADLEIGWLPLVLRDSGNPAIQPGRPGYFEAAASGSPCSTCRPRARPLPTVTCTPPAIRTPSSIRATCSGVGEALAGAWRAGSANAAAYQAGLQGLRRQVAGRHRALGKGGAAAAWCAGARPSP
jgi:zinc/manganese transport system substrate-binding protein